MHEDHDHPLLKQQLLEALDAIKRLEAKVDKLQVALNDLELAVGHLDADLNG